MKQTHARQIVPLYIAKHLGQEDGMSLIGRLRAAQTALAVTNLDPWLVRLERVRGKVGDDGVERISTQTLFDHLEVRQSNRTAGACRRLAQVMRELGWTAVRVRDVTRGGYLENVRGYCRKSQCGDQPRHAASWKDDTCG
jgi:hypothetical protein